MTLEFNADVLTALHKYYEGLLTRVDFPLRVSCRDSVLDFVRSLQDVVEDTAMQASYARVVLRNASLRKAQIQSHLSTQSALKMEFMTSVAQRDAVVMKIITFIALIYLPATFVSTFFSTDIIKYQNQNEFGRSLYTSSFSKLALERWLEITLPLTVITLSTAWWYFKREEKKKHLTLSSGVK